MEPVTSAASISTEAAAFNFLQQLKSATAQQHNQLEEQELLKMLMSPALTVPQYRAYLIIMRQVLLAYDTHVLPVISNILPGFNPGTAIAQIENDLQCIGGNEHYATIKPFPIPNQCSHQSFALGYIYVIEGSKLGGKVIYKQIQRVLGLTHSSGSGYLANVGEDTGRPWKQFLAAFSTYVLVNNIQVETIAGAKHAFTSIYDHYQNNRVLYAV